MRKKSGFMFLTVSFFALLLAGCAPPATTATVSVQLTHIGAETTAYPAAGITVYLDGLGELTAVTDENGVAVFTVSQTGTCFVSRVDGADVSSSNTEGATGLEFAKSSPLADPYPNWTRLVAGGPSVNVTELGRDYAVDLPVPDIIKVTVLKVGSVTGTPTANVATGVNAFMGRVIISNISASDNRMAITIRSNDAGGNRFMIEPNTSGANPEIFTVTFYGATGTSLGTVSNYTQTGPIYIEAPGTDSGDWAMGCNLSMTNLKTRLVSLGGGADATRNFPGFMPTAVISISSTAGGTPTYSLSYRIFTFETL